jgi:ferredoxin-thioredoxin reductase catalytic subunit
MINMMIGFFKDYFKYKESAKKQQRWLEKYCEQKNYALNPSWMMLTNLKSNLCEMEATFGKRYCPCFEPSGDEVLDKKMMCPCEFIDDEIAEYGTCHCALFGPADLSKADWKASSQRLMDEYQVPKNITDGVLDTRGMPLDPRRSLPIPDAMHQVKSTLNGFKGKTLTVIVEREQEAKNLEEIATYRNLGFSSSQNNDHFEVLLEGIK